MKNYKLVLSVLLVACSGPDRYDRLSGALDGGEGASAGASGMAGSSADGGGLGGSAGVSGTAGAAGMAGAAGVGDVPDIGGAVPLIHGRWDVWYDSLDVDLADGSRVLSWEPRRGSVAATAPDDTTAPVLDADGWFANEPAILFSGGQRLRAHALAPLYDGQQPITIVAVLQPTATTTTITVASLSGPDHTHQADIHRNNGVAFLREGVDGVMGSPLFGRQVADGARAALGWSYDAFSVVQMLNDVKADTIKTVRVGDVVADEFSIGARVKGNTVNQQFTGYIRAFGVTADTLTADDIENVWRMYVARDPAPVWFVGDSLTLGTGSTAASGLRKLFWEKAASADYNVELVGTLDDGVNWAHTKHDGHTTTASGTITVARRVVQNFFGAGKQIPKAAVINLLIGTNDCNDDGGNFYDSVLTPQEYAELLEWIHSEDSNARIAVTTLPPIDPVKFPQAASNITDFNSKLPAIWDAYDAVPGRNLLIRWDASQAVGGTFDQQYFSNDGVHPNNAGYAEMMNDPVHGYWQAAQLFLQDL